jgi:hypothetical protein
VMCGEMLLPNQAASQTSVGSVVLVSFFCSFVFSLKLTCSATLLVARQVILLF